MGGPFALIGPAMNLASAAGSKGGGGGISPEQAALAQFHLGQDLLHARSTFAGTGTGASTMATQAAGGARLKEALELARASNANQQAAAQQQQQLQGATDQSQEDQRFQAGSQSVFGTGTQGTFSTQDSAGSE